MLNQIKGLLIYSSFIFSILVFPDGSHSAYGNVEISVEISGHFGKKFQEYGAWNFGADALLYKRSFNDNLSAALGVRYRYLFKSLTESTNTRVGDDTFRAEGSGKRNAHRLALLTNYRFQINQIFIGAIIGIDIWKSLNATINSSASGGGQSATLRVDVTSNQFLWNKITGQLALEVGYMITPNFLVKLEAGYDAFGFNKYKMEGSINEQEEETEVEDDLKYNGVYATLGLGYFFGSSSSN